MQPTTYYCPNCGQPLTNEGIQQLARGGELIQVACFNRTCKVYRATTVTQSIADGMFQDCWNFKTNFNYKTGEPINDRPDSAE